jgi:hypothetical protein
LSLPSGVAAADMIATVEGKCQEPARKVSWPER